MPFHSGHFSRCEEAQFLIKTIDRGNDFLRIFLFIKRIHSELCAHNNSLFCEFVSVFSSIFPSCWMARDELNRATKVICDGNGAVNGEWLANSASLNDCLFIHRFSRQDRYLLDCPSFSSVVIRRAFFRIIPKIISHSICHCCWCAVAKRVRLQISTAFFSSKATGQKSGDLELFYFSRSVRWNSLTKATRVKTWNEMK